MLTNANKLSSSHCKLQDEKQEFFETVVSMRNKEYCNEHNMEYIEITDGVEPVRGQYFWFKSSNKKNY